MPFVNICLFDFRVWERQILFALADEPKKNFPYFEYWKNILRVCIFYWKNMAEVCLLQSVTARLLGRYTENLSSDENC